MSAESWTLLARVLLACTAVASLAAWLPKGRRIWAPASLGLLVAAGIIGASLDTVTAESRATVTLVVVLGGVAAIAGGGPLTGLVFDLVDRREPEAAVERAGHVLRGGAWIGALERTAIYGTLVASWPAGLAVVLAVKGLGRYPELRAAEDGVRTGAAERFIIGTFTSVLWACGCAAVVLMVG